MFATFRTEDLKITEFLAFGDLIVYYWYYLLLFIVNFQQIFFSGLLLIVCLRNILFHLEFPWFQISISVLKLIA